MDTKNRLKKLLKSEHFRKKTYNCTDFGTIIKQIFVPIPVLPKKGSLSNDVGKEKS